MLFKVKCVFLCEKKSYFEKDLARRYNKFIYKILTCLYSQTQLQVYVYMYIYIIYLLYATGFGLYFRPSSGPLLNLKCG